MDIGKIFECLEEDNRTFAISIAMAFPMSYVDCWKLVPDFRNFDIFPQIMLSLGLSVMFVLLGVFNAILLIQLTEKHSPSPNQYSVTGVLYTFLVASVVVAAGFVKAIPDFLWLFGCVYSFFPFLFLIINLLCKIFPKYFK